MPSLDVLKTVTVRYATEGEDRARSSLAGVTAAYDKLGASAVQVARSTDTSSKGMLSVANALETAAKRSDTTYGAFAKLAQQQNLLNRAQAQGLEGTRQYAVLQAAYAREAERLAGANDNLAKGAMASAAALHGHADAVGLNRIQMMEATHVAKSLFDQLAAGASPVRALSVEAGRIGQIFTMGSNGFSVSGAFSQASTMAGAFFSKIGVAGIAFGALATAAGVGVAALLAYENAQIRLQRAVEGTGRAAGLSRDQLDAMARSGAQTGNLGLGDARTAAAGFAQAGVSGDLISRAVGDSARFGRFTDQSTGDAGKALADALRDPVEGASALDKVFGNLNDRLRTSIEDLEAQGRHADAQRVLLDAFESSLKRTTDSTTVLGQVMGELKRWAGSLVDSTGGLVNHLLGGDRSPEERLRSYQDQLPHTFDSPLAVGNLSRSYVQAQIDQAKKEIVDRALPTADPAAQARDAAADRLSNQVGPLVRSLMPEIAKAQTATNTLELLRAALADPQVIGKLGGGIDAQQVQGAFGRQAIVAANDDPLARMRLDFDLAIAGINAVSLAERAAVDARRAELQVLRETGDVAKASAAAQDALNLAMAKARSDAEDRLTTAQQNLAMVGMSPFQRGLQEIENRYKGDGGIFDKDRATASGLTTAMAPVQADLRSAGDILANALREIAEKARSAFLTVDGKPTGSPYGALSSVGGSGALSRAPSTVFPMISGAADQTGIDPRIIAAIGEVENGFRLTGGTSMLGSNGRPSSAYGYGQLTNGAAADVAAAVPGFSKYNPSTAVFGSAEYLKILMDRKGGDLTSALNAYGGDPAYASKIYAHAGLLSAPAVTIRPNMDDAAATMAADRGAYSADRSAYVQGQQEGPLKAANTALDGQIALMKAQQDALGKTKDQIAGVAAAQTLLNQYTSQGVPVTAQMRTEIAAYGERAAAAAKSEMDFQAQQQRLVSAMDDVRDAGRGFLQPFGDALMHGTSLLTAFKSGLDSIASKLMSRAEDSLIDSLFGARGTSSGGLLGGGLTSLFSGHLFANGGIMTSSGPLPLHRYATGGIASAPQLAMFGEGRTPEAYVPLPDGKRIPVAMASGDQGGQSVTDARSYSFDLRGSDLTEAQVDARFRRALDERDRQFGDNVRNVNRRAA